MAILQNIKNPHASNRDEFLKTAGCDSTSGLSEKKALQRLNTYGKNKLVKSKQKPVWKILAEQFTSPVMYLLVAAGALSFLFGDIPEGIAIGAVIMLNAAIGFWMEFQARQSMATLRSMDKITAKVVRNGEEKDRDAEEIVPGDVVLLESGALVPADLRLIEVSELQINESPLTGESVPVEKKTESVPKNAQTGDRKNMAYKGTSVTRGKARGIVIATGMDTEIGNISQLVSSADEDEIPLNRKLSKLSKNLIWLVLILAFGLGVIGYIAEKELYRIIQTSIAWAIAAIPEGLPIVASIALARGMLRLSNHNVIVKRLASVETLGETNTIFTDKTGTLTQNRLTVESLSTGIGQHGRAQWKGEEVTLKEVDRDSQNFKRLFDISVLANDAVYDPKHEENSEGDPLEIGLLKFARAFDPERINQLHQLEFVGEDPFDSESKMMGTVYTDGKKFIISAKGAAESILDICTHKLEKEKVTRLTDGEKEKIAAQSDAMSENGLRTLAFAYRDDAEKPAGIEDHAFLDELVYVGLIGFVDPPGPGIKEAIETFHTAGIEVVMVTGDHPGTALNIARQVSLVAPDEDRVIHGRDLKEDQFKNEEIAATRVFSRVDPSQKLRLIDGFQDQNKIVGMTGDGVNDAPALKKADIGIAMGKRGTQAAREVADMVLRNDAFPSILEAVKEGRIIFSNIRKFIIYQLSYHFSEVLVIAAVMLLLFELALEPLQLLYLNILLDVFPALALGIGRGRAAVLKEPPKDPKVNIITHKNWLAIIVYGIVIAASVSGVYFYGYYRMGLTPDIANNVAFFTLAFAQLFNVLNMRDPDENMFVNQVTRNKWVWGSLALCLGALLAAYWIPLLSGVLSLSPMGFDVWKLVIIGALVPAIVIQGIKQFVKS